MTSPFEGAARAAIEEIILKHAQSGKFGFILSEQALAEATDDLYGLLVTSRSLKAAGDKFIQQSIDPNSTRQAAKRSKW